MFELCSMWLVLGLTTLGVDAVDAARERLGPRLAPFRARLASRRARIRERWQRWRDEAPRPPAQLPGACVRVKRFSLVTYLLPPPEPGD